MKNLTKNNDNKIYDVVIIGAGAAGLFAAGFADFHAKGLILEKTSRPGTKLLMSGSGQCNITHSGSIKDFISCYGDKGKKIRSCLYKHSNLNLIKFLEVNSIPVFIREDGKVFPKSMKARDVLDMLLEKAEKNGFELKYDSRVTRLQAADNLESASEAKAVNRSLWQISCAETVYHARNVVIATGGCSYPSTGSDGSFFDVLSDCLGIKITELKPALTPIRVNEYPYSELSGISFDGVDVSIWHEEKKIAETCEALLFTHKELSGPAVINISKHASAGDKLKINYVYPLNYEQVLERLRQAFHCSKGSAANLIASEFALPKRFCQLLTARHGEALKSLARNLSGEEFIIDSVSGFDKAMATGGGVALEQMNTSDFAFKDFTGLYAVGEALDIDGITGGYNLQFTYSSACAAMSKIKESL